MSSANLKMLHNVFSEEQCEMQLCSTASGMHSCLQIATIGSGKKEWDTYVDNDNTMMEAL